MDSSLALAIGSAAALALLHSLWQLALLALLASLGFALMRGTSARARHAAGMAWLLAMAAAPVLTFAWCWHALATTGAPGHGALGARALPPLAPLASVADADALRAEVLAHAWSSWLLFGLAQAWLVGAALMALRQFGGWRVLRRIECEPCVPLPPEWVRRVDVLRAALGISRAVTVRLAAHVVSPFTARALRPLVWLPLALLTQLPCDQVEVLLAHELAHVRRLDWCWNALQCVIESLLFHHPAMWWLSRRVREEREHACDDLAVGVCGDAVVLAEALAALQRRRPGPSAPRLSFALAAEGGSLMKRVAHLLSATPARPGWRWPGVFVLLLCSGSLLATQVPPGADVLVNLRFDASSDGPLTAGNYRQYAASYVGGKHRLYRISMDGAGHVDEQYREDGLRKPIHDGVRQWLRTVMAMNAGPIARPPAPPVPPAPPRPPWAPRPAPLSPAPAPSDSVEFQALMATIASDPRVVALTGPHAVADRASFHGSVHTWGVRDFHLWGIDDPAGGQARFSMTFAGPDGRVAVAWAGRTDAGVWKADSMVVSPQAG